MEFKLNHPRLAADDVVVRTSWISGNRVFHRGKQLKGRWGKYVVPTSTGEVHLTVRGVLWDSVPNVEVDDERYHLLPPLPWYVTVVCSLPLLLAISGGAVGGFFGACAMFANISVVRSELPLAVKIPAMIASTIAAFIGFLVIVVALQLLFQAF